MTLDDLSRSDAGAILSVAALALGVLLVVVLARARSLGFAGLVVIAMTPLVPTAPTPVGSGLSTDDILPLLGTATLLAELARTRSGRQPRLTWLQAAVLVGFAIVVVGGTISAVVNGHDVSSFVRLLLKGAGRFAFLGVIAWSVGSVVARDRRLVLVAAWAIAVMGTIEAIFGLVAYAIPLPGRIGLGGTKPWSVLGGGAVPGRIEGTLGISSNFTGAILMVTLLVSVGLALRTQGRTRIAWLCAVLVQLLALALTFSRAPLGLGLVGVVAILLLTSRPILLLPLAAIAGVLTVATPLVARFMSDSTDRLALWTAAFRVMLDHPLGGVGPGALAAFVRAHPKYAKTAFGHASNNAHNTILLAGAELGVVAALGSIVLNVAVAVLAVLTIRRTAARATRDPLVLSGAVAVLAFLGQGMVNNLFTVAVTGVLLALCLGAFVWTGSHEPRTEPA